MVLALLLILTVYSEAEAQKCSFQPSGVGSGVPDLQQVSTLPYCFIDECTIMRTDTGQELDIVYTSDSIVVVTASGNQISMAIAVKKGEHLSCLTANNFTTIIHLSWW